MKTRCRRGYTKHLGFNADWAKFDNFLREMGERPDGTTLDRIDGTLGYFKENCRWATPLEQTRNRTRTRYYEYAGKRATAAEFADEYGLTYHLAKSRLDRGQSLSDAPRYLSPKDREEALRLRGSGFSRAEVAAKFGVTYQAVAYWEKQ